MGLTSTSQAIRKSEFCSFDCMKVGSFVNFRSSHRLSDVSYRVLRFISVEAGVKTKGDNKKLAGRK